ncbi:MAG: hypothetical protein RBT71_02865 [Flavobacteriales bacterium]|jgi:hypothetical protein|nr:hypothetical protein [Flavobacteriales bacterium]
MSPVLRNFLAVLLGAVACIFLNGFLLSAMMKLIGTPAGFDPGDAGTYGLLEGRYFLSPFIAHAVPSLVGGAIAAWLAATRKMAMALVVGALHLLGGIAAAFMVPAPAWFVALDLAVAYLPMAWLGGRWGARR